MNTTETIKSCNTHKLFILNEVSKKFDINHFDRIYINSSELIIFIGNYNYNMYQELYNLYGKPKTYYFKNDIQTVFTTETIEIVLKLNINQ